MCAVIRQAMGDRYGHSSGGHALTHREHTLSMWPAWGVSRFNIAAKVWNAGGKRSGYLMLMFKCTIDRRYKGKQRCFYRLYKCVDAVAFCVTSNLCAGAPYCSHGLLKVQKERESACEMHEHEVGANGVFLFCFVFFEQRNKGA